MQIDIDPKAPTPPSEQIADQVRFAVAAGRLAPGDRLPSVRGLATTARVNPNTVARAYRELERDRTVETRPGDGVFVAARAAARCRSAARRVLGERLSRVIDAAVAAGLTQDDIDRMVAEALERAAQEILR